MSGPYCLAVAVRHGTVRLTHLHDFEDQELMDLVRRIKVHADPDMPSNSCRLVVRTKQGEFTKEYISTPETFNWDRSETVERLAAIVDDMPFREEGLRHFVDTSLDLDNRTVRDLVDATFASKM